MDIPASSVLAGHGRGTASVTGWLAIGGSAGWVGQRILRTGFAHR